MALVRRPTAVGRAAVPTTYTTSYGVVGSPGSVATAGPIASVGAAAPSSSVGPAPSIPHQAAGPDGAAAGSAPPAAAPPPEPFAVAVPTLPAHPIAVIGALGIAVWGAVAGMGLVGSMHVPVFRVDNTMSAFGALFAFAGAVERVLEPITRWMPGRKPAQKYEQALADQANGVPGATRAAAVAKAACERSRASRGVLMWGIATGAATVISAAGGFYLLHVLAADPGWDAIPKWVDALVTGLVVGSGTKPLHDLISKVQKQKESSADQS